MDHVGHLVLLRSLDKLRGGCHFAGAERDTCDSVAGSGVDWTSAVRHGGEGRGLALLTRPSGRAPFHAGSGGSAVGDPIARCGYDGKAGRESGSDGIVVGTRNIKMASQQRGDAGYVSQIDTVRLMGGPSSHDLPESAAPFRPRSPHRLGPFSFSSASFLGLLLCLFSRSGLAPLFTSKSIIALLVSSPL